MRRAEPRNRGGYCVVNVNETELVRLPEAPVTVTVTV
jgi:hypothetical protein